MEVCKSPHCDPHEDHQPAQLAAKVKKKTKCADCAVMAVIGKTALWRNTCAAPQREGKKTKTTLNAYSFRQILDKKYDEYAKQATFSLSYFDAMTHIMRAEPIPNDVKVHIILGQNCMKTQAKYDFFQKHQPISTSFCACWTKMLNASHTKWTLSGPDDDEIVQNARTENGATGCLWKSMINLHFVVSQIAS